MMPDLEKVFDAIRNCITEPKCKDCPWDDCERFDCKRVNVPVTLLLDALKLLKEQDAIVRCKDCKYCTIAADKKWRQDFGKSIYECDHKGLCYVEPDWFCADGLRKEEE